MEHPRSIIDIHQSYLKASTIAERSNSVRVQLAACLDFLETTLSLPRTAVIGSYIQEFLSMMAARTPKALGFGVFPSYAEKIVFLLGRLPKELQWRQAREREVIRGIAEIYLAALALISEREKQRFGQPSRSGHSIDESGVGLDIFRERVRALSGAIEEVADYAERLVSEWQSFELQPAVTPIVLFVEKVADADVAFPWAYLERIQVEGAATPEVSGGRRRALVINIGNVSTNFAEQCSIAIDLACRTAVEKFGVPRDRMPYIFRLGLGSAPFEYIGSSAGLGLSLAALGSSCEAGETGIDISFVRDYGFVGGVDQQGNVKAVSESGLRWKIRAAMASPLSGILVPRENEATCRREIENALVDGDGRELGIIPVGHIEEVLADRRVVKVRRRSLEAGGAMSAVSASVPYKVSILALLMFVLFMLGIFLPVKPEIKGVRLEDQTLLFMGMQERPLWALPMDEIASGNKEWTLDATLQVDLHGDRRKEWAVAVRERGSDEAGRRSLLLCCSPEFGLLWATDIGADIDFAGKKIAGNFSTNELLAVKNGGEPRLVAVSNHRTAFFCCVTSFTRTGEEAGRYLHVGHLGVTPEQRMLIDIDKDGAKELLLGGTNFSHRQAVLAVLDPFDLWGVGPFDRDYDFYIRPDLRGSERRYLRFPKGDIALAEEAPTTVAGMSLTGGKLRVEVLEDENNAGTFFLLDKDWKESGRGVTSHYASRHAELVDLARIVPADPYIQEEPSPILYWDGEDWTTIPSDNRIGKPIKEIKLDNNGSIRALIDVPVTEPWFDTGVDVVNGSYLSIIGHGRAHSSNKGEPAYPVNIYYLVSSAPGSIPIAPGIPFNYPVAKIGADGEPFVIPGKFAGPIDESGRLFLANNKYWNDYPTAWGFWRFEVIVDPPGAPQVETWGLDFDSRTGMPLLRWRVLNADNVSITPGPGGSEPAEGYLALGSGLGELHFSMVATNEKGTVTRNLIVPAAGSPPEIVEFTTLYKSLTPISRQILRYRTQGALLVRLIGNGEQALLETNGATRISPEFGTKLRLDAVNRQGTATAAVSFDRSPKREITILVPSERVWYPTGIELSRGWEFQMSASGLIDVGGELRSPDGTDALAPPPTGKKFVDFVAPGLPVNALVGRVGRTGRPFLVGGKFDGAADNSGELFLCVNDRVCKGCFEDNSGAWTVTITW